MINKEKTHFDISFFLVLLCISLIVAFAQNIVFYSIYAAVLLGVIYHKAKFSFFTALSFILVFSLYQTMIQSLTRNARGMIKNAIVRIPLYENEHGLCTISFLMTLVFFILFTDLIKNELKLYQVNIRMTNLTAILLIFTSIVLTILMFPSFPDFKLHLAIRRSQSLLGNYGWVLTALVLAGLTVDMAYKMKWLWGCYALIAFWIFGHAERVECLGFIIYLVLKIINRRELTTGKKNINDNLSLGNKHTFWKKTVIFSGLFVVFLLLIVLGIYRDVDSGNRTKFTLVGIINNLLVQATAGDVIYVFDCAVDMWKKGNLVHGITYIDWILNMIPGASAEYQVAYYIKNWYFTMGGALFFTEPMMNFGMIGVFTSNIIFCFFYSFIVKKQTMLRAMIFMPMVIEIFRTTWYGRNGWQLTSFIEIPLIYLGITLVTNKFEVTI